MKKRLYIFRILLLFWWVSIALLVWDISIKFDKSLFRTSLYNNTIFTWLEEISWELYNAPFNSLYPFLGGLSEIDEILYLQTYDFSEKRIKKSIKNLLDDWVDVKLIMEDQKYRQYQSTFKQIQKYFTWYSNFEIKSDWQMKTNFVHSKIAIMDDKFWIQTANLTHSSFFKNREHFFSSSHSWVYESLKWIFLKDWVGDKILPEDIHPNLLVCNINCRSGIEELLSSAEESIVIQTQYITDPTIMNILTNKIYWDSSIDPLDIKILVADTDTNDDLLYRFGSDIVRKFQKTYNHTKMILVDDEILLLWSMNLSTNSLDKNREVGIFLTSYEHIHAFHDWFEDDWNFLK